MISALFIQFLDSCQCSSDTEDLFDGYDSIIADSSFLAKLQDVETQEEHRNPPKLIKEDPTDTLILEELAETSFRDLPSSQLAFQQEVTRLNHSVTSTPGLRDLPLDVPQKSAGVRPRRSMAEQLKAAMMENAALSGRVSMTTLYKEAAVSAEMGVAVQALESVPIGRDLGPFFGLPSKVKDLIMRLKSIQDLYGERLTSLCIYLCYLTW